MAKEPRELRLIVRGQPTGCVIDPVVPRIPWIVKDAARERLRSCVSWDNVHMHVAVLVLQKHVVEVIRSKCEREGTGGSS